MLALRTTLLGGEARVGFECGSGGGNQVGVGCAVALWGDEVGEESALKFFVGLEALLAGDGFVQRILAVPRSVLQLRLR